MLTRKQHELLTFIQTRLEATGISPSFEEMKEALDLKSKSGVHRLISAMEERGFIRRLPNRARALEVIRESDAGSGKTAQRAAANASSALAPLRSSAPAREPANDVIEIPLHGRIAAGVPIEAMDEFQETRRGTRRPQLFDGPGRDAAATVDREPGRLVDH